MSYINDALIKAQKDKKSPYAACEPILSVSGKKNKMPQKRFLLTGMLMLLLCAAGIAAFLYWPEVKKPAVTKPLKIAPVQSAVPAEPQVVKEAPTALNKNEAVLKTETVPASAEMKAGPDNADSQNLYAQAIKKQQEGKLEKAKELYKRVIKIDPQNIQALNNLGVIYMKKRSYKWAIIRLNDALKVKYDYPDAHYNLACLYAQQNDARKSLVHLKKAIRFNPEARNWAQNDGDLKVWADLPKFKKLLEKQ